MPSPHPPLLPPVPSPSAPSVFFSFLCHVLCSVEQRMIFLLFQRMYSLILSGVLEYCLPQ